MPGEVTKKSPGFIPLRCCLVVVVVDVFVVDGVRLGSVGQWAW